MLIRSLSITKRMEEGIDLSEHVPQENIADIPESDNKGHDYIELDTVGKIPS